MFAQQDGQAQGDLGDIHDFLPSFDKAMVNQTVMHVVSDLLGYSPAVVRAGAAPEAMPPLKVFAHTFRFVSTPMKLVWPPSDSYGRHSVETVDGDEEQGPIARGAPHARSSAGAPLIVAVEGDGARQPFHQEGNGLNVGLFGTVDLADALAQTRYTGAPRPRERQQRDQGQTDAQQIKLAPRAALAKRQELAKALASLMTDESLRRAVKEVLFNQGTVEARININRWNTPTWLGMHSNWHDYRWHELTTKDQRLWQALGWNRDRWMKKQWQAPRRVEATAPQAAERQGRGPKGARGGPIRSGPQHRGIISWLLTTGRSMFDVLLGVVGMGKAGKGADGTWPTIRPFCPHALGYRWETLELRARQAASALRVSKRELKELWEVCSAKSSDI